MNTSKKTIKTILGCTSACSAILLSGAGVMNLTRPNYEVQAVSVDSISVSISNSNFNNSTSTSYPFSPSSFTETGSSNGAEANVTAGVIKLSHEKYSSDFKDAVRDSLDDDYVLMINSTKKDDKNNVTSHVVEYGYTTNSSINLEANSKYMITADVFTATDAGIASLRLIDEDGEIYSSIDNINSHNHWTPYSFFISTNNAESLNLKLGLYLDGAGIVLFDNISCQKLSDFGYNLNKTTATSGTYVEKTEVDNVITTFTINASNQLVANLEDDDDENDIISNFTDYEYEFGKGALTYVSEADGSKAAKVINSEETYSQYDTDDIFTFAPNRLYKVSIDVKTKNITGTASLQMIRTDLDEEDEDYDADSHNKSIKITTNTHSTSNSVTNDYKTYSFLIRTHSTKTLTYKLRFGLGLTDAKSSGEMYLSKIEVSKINYSHFNSTDSNSTAIDFVSAYSNNSNMLDNADFNAFEIEDYNSPIPAKAVNWEVATGSNTQKYGVVNTLTLDEDLADLKLSNLSNPSPNENNNVLMMYSETKDSLSYVSNTKSLDAKSYHKFDIDVQTQNAPITVALVTTNDNGEITLVEKTINTNFTWEQVSLYLYTGHQKMDVKLKLTLNTSGYGYAYVDNAKFDWVYLENIGEIPATETQVEEAFKKASNSTTTAVADLSNLISSASNENFATPYYFNLPSTDQYLQKGTVTFNSSELYDIIDSPEVLGETNLNKFNAIASTEIDKKALAIWSNSYINYTATSSIGFSLVKGSDTASANYYKITVDVFTQNLATAEGSKYGAGIKLTGFDNSFTNIVSNNEWTTYTFYVKPDADTTTYLELSLGDETNKTSGAVFFTNITFDDTITASEYKTVNETNIIKVVKTEETEEETDSDNTSNNSNDNTQTNANWMYIIPGALTVAAILIVIVGVLARKIKWKNLFKRKSKTSYDRNKTVSIQYYSRKATTMREEKVRELTQDLNKINDERKKYEEQYKQDLSKLRELKIKRANQADIAKLEKEMKKTQKLSASLGSTANRINEELSYVQTETYLNSLIRKLQREQDETDNSDKE